MQPKRPRITVPATVRWLPHSPDALKRRTLSTIALALGLLFLGVPAFAADQASRQVSPAPQTSTAGASSKTQVTFSGGIMDALDAKQKLAIGDSVIFRVLEDQEDPKALSISDSGELHVPELGLVTAAGKTCKELAFELKTKLEQTTYYRATVIIGIQALNKTISGRRVYVAGQVRLTGAQEIPGGETWTVSRAIMGAGGFTDYADKKQVRLVRAGSKGTPGKSYILNIAAVLEKGQTDNDMSVEPEDLIYVSARAVNF